MKKNAAPVSFASAEEKKASHKGFAGVPTKKLTMRDAELRPYIGRLVELKFVHGEEVIGRLVADPQAFPGNRYAMELPVSASREARIWRPIPDSAVIQSVRSLEGLP